jgi:hypothetical protein
MFTSLKTKRRAIATLLAIAILAAAILIYLFYLRAAASPEGILITIERTPCFGTCPDYRLEIDGSGKVVYEGRGFVEVKGTRTAYISERKVRELAAEFERIGFYQLEDHYAIPATDLPSVIVSINFEGKSKTVNIYGGGAPKELMDLVEQIEETVNVSHWVGKP